MSGFPEAVRRLREAAGFSSARSFYRGRGGQRFFGCTYKAYLNIEAGRSIPQPALALRIAEGLRVLETKDRARQFVTAYLASTVGTEELAGFLVRVLSEPKAETSESTLLQKASDSSFVERVKPLTHEQAELLCGDYAVYWCFALLSDEDRHFGIADISRLLRLDLGKCKAALGKLVKAELIAKDRDGLYSCPEAHKIFTYPRDKFFIPKKMAALKAHWSAMAARQGRMLFSRSLLIRASEGRLKHYFPQLISAINGVHLYSRRQPSKDSALFVLQGDVRRLVRF